MSPRVARACERAERWAASPVVAGEGEPSVPVVASAVFDGREVFAVGDPQTTDERFFSVLDARGLLGDDGMLLPDVGLVTIGDHFDFKEPEGWSVGDVAASGLRLLAWLVAHPPSQVHLVLGNHDTARVMELHRMTDEGMAAARALAATIRDEHLAGRETGSWCARFAREHSDFPTPMMAWRDWSAFSEAQRALLQRAIVAGRTCLAVSAVLGDLGPALLTHAGVTRRESELLERERGGPVAGAVGLADALNDKLRCAIDEVAPSWRRGATTALSLDPLHRPGAGPSEGELLGREGGGLLYHRPSDPSRDGADPRAFADERRFHPRELVAEVAQVCGHIGHKKALEELDAWAAPSARTLPLGRLRRLTVSAEGEVSYHSHDEAPRAAVAATLVMIDGDMNHEALDLADYELLPLAAAP